MAPEQREVWHYWYSRKMHRGLVSSRDDTPEETWPVCFLGTSSVLIHLCPGDRLATFRTPSRDPSGHSWDDIVYVGAFDPAEVKRVDVRSWPPD